VSIAQSLDGIIRDEKQTCPVGGGLKRGSLEERAAVDCMFDSVKHILRTVDLEGLKEISNGFDSHFQPPTFKDPTQHLLLSKSLIFAGEYIPAALPGSDALDATSVTYTAKFAENYENQRDLKSYSISGDNVEEGKKFAAECPPGGSETQINCSNEFCDGSNGRCAPDSYFSGCPCQNSKCETDANAENRLDCDDNECNDVWQDGYPELCLAVRRPNSIYFPNSMGAPG
jgi:hypothetical protein